MRHNAQSAFSSWTVHILQNNLKESISNPDGNKSRTNQVWLAYCIVHMLVPVYLQAAGWCEAPPHDESVDLMIYWSVSYPVVTFSSDVIVLMYYFRSNFAILLSRLLLVSRSVSPVIFLLIWAPWILRRFICFTLLVCLSMSNMRFLSLRGALRRFLMWQSILLQWRILHIQAVCDAIMCFFYFLLPFLSIFLV